MNDSATFPKATIEVLDIRCDRGRNEATISVNSSKNRVSVSGTIDGKNTCDELRIVTFSSEDPYESLVEISVQEQHSDGCESCPSSIDYDATVSYGSELPSEVQLIHITPTDTAVVAQTRP